MIEGHSGLTEIHRLDDAAAALALFEPLRLHALEAIAFAYLDPERRVLALRHSLSGSTCAATVPVRDVVADALAFDAASVVMAHNHPGGDPAPSAADIAATRRLARALDAVEVRLLDHIIIARHGEISFRDLGLL